MARSVYIPEPAPAPKSQGGGLTLTLEKDEAIVIEVGGEQVRIVPRMVTKRNGRKAPRVSIQADRERVKVWREK